MHRRLLIHFLILYGRMAISVSTERLKWHPMPDKMAGKLVTSNIASASNQWYSKDSVFWLAQMTLYVMALCKFQNFWQAWDVISMSTMSPGTLTMKYLVSFHGSVLNDRISNQYSYRTSMSNTFKDGSKHISWLW